MSELKYKVGDCFEDKHMHHNSIEITALTNKGDGVYVIKGYPLTNEVSEEWIDDYYEKVEEQRPITFCDDGVWEKQEGMNIEENKHHLLWGDTQSIDIMKLVLTREEYIGFLKGQILKYQLRLGKKDDTEKEKKKIDDYTKELNRIL